MYSLPGSPPTATIWPRCTFAPKPTARSASRVVRASSICRAPIYSASRESQRQAWPLGWGGSGVRGGLLAPAALDVAQHLGVHERVAERLDRRQVDGAAAAVRLDEGGHLPAGAAGTVLDPAQVHDAVHGLVRDLGGELVAGRVQRRERERPGAGSRRAVAQVVGQAVAQGGHPRADPGARLVPAEQAADLPA